MKPFTVIDVDQRSPEWLAARSGRVTGSTAKCVTAKGRGSEESMQRVNLRTKLALERITGKSLEKNFTTQAMEQGIEREPMALAAYEAETGALITQTGFLQHNREMIGCSLDAHVGDFEGLVSIKCPEITAHWETLRTLTISGDYMRQIEHEMLVTGAAWADYVSFNPDFEGPLQLCIIRVKRDDAKIADYATKLTVFLKEVDTLEADIRAMAAKVA